MIGVLAACLSRNKRKKEREIEQQKKIQRRLAYLDGSVRSSWQYVGIILESSWEEELDSAE